MFKFNTNEDTAGQQMSTARAMTYESYTLTLFNESVLADNHQPSQPLITNCSLLGRE